MLDVVKKQAAAAKVEAERTAKVLKQAKAGAAEADDMLAVAETAKAEIEAEEKIRRNREKLAASVDVCKRNAAVSADALRAADKAKRDADKASAQAEAELGKARSDYAYADYILSETISRILGDGEMAEADLLVKLPEAILIERDRQLDIRLGGSGCYNGYAPLEAYDSVRDQTDWWIDQLRGDGPLVSLYYRAGDKYKTHPFAKDVKAEGLQPYVSQEAVIAEAKRYLKSKYPDEFEPLPDEPNKEPVPKDGPIIEDGPLQGQRRYTALT